MGLTKKQQEFLDFIGDGMDMRRIMYCGIFSTELHIKNTLKFFHNTDLIEPDPLTGGWKKTQSVH